MIAVDTNVLVYAHRLDSPFYKAANRAVRELAEGLTNWALPWPCLHEFFGVVTNRRLYRVPTPVDVALSQLDSWLESPTVRLLSESPGHFTQLSELIRSATVLGPQIYDAKIAAICLSHGVRELLTMDRDYSRYPALKTRSLIA
jgi:toxin-antitoxin system PIN domain toxin